MLTLKRTILAVCLIAGTFCLSAPAAVLYDGTLGTLPEAQGWNYLTDPLAGASATHVAGGGVTTLDTTPAVTDSAGFFSEVPLLGTNKHPGLGALDRGGDGYTVRFDLRIAAESHSSNDRAGFAVIALSSDKVGLELSFWAGEIWAQSDAPLFTHAEGAAFDTTAAEVRYDLAILGNGYRLFADGVEKLSGQLRDYSAHPHPVYNETDFLFFGDDTSSAAGISELGYIEVLPYAVPEPISLFVLSGCALLLVRRR